MDGIDQCRTVERNAPFKLDLDPGTGRCIGRRLQQLTETIESRECFKDMCET